MIESRARDLANREYVAPDKESLPEWMKALNDPHVFDELVVFKGASYWRALGKGQKYGISARGIAVDTGAEGVTEEFPMFREFWLKKPQEGMHRTVWLGLSDDVGPLWMRAVESYRRRGELAGD